MHQTQIETPKTLSAAYQQNRTMPGRKVILDLTLLSILNTKIHFVY
jgi:hypothetical protein